MGVDLASGLFRLRNQQHKGAQFSLLANCQITAGFRSAPLIQGLTAAIGFQLVKGRDPLFSECGYTGPVTVQLLYKADLSDGIAQIK